MSYSLAWEGTWRRLVAGGVGEGGGDEGSRPPSPRGAANMASSDGGRLAPTTLSAPSARCIFFLADWIRWRVRSPLPLTG